MGCLVHKSDLDLSLQTLKAYLLYACAKHGFMAQQPKH
jgi:hypothetical protein